jgi:ABC-type uncharacterized transport system ATPase subunit
MNVQPLIKTTGITKSFPGVLANDHIDFDLLPGEVHTLLGENGAGKTTLMNILYGLYQPDEGHIEICGQESRIRSPKDSLKLGIGMVHQHFALIPNLSVLENLILGFEGGFVLNIKVAEKKLKQISEEYGQDIDPHELIQNLSVGARQRTEIIKTLFRGSEALILDEPTSVLTPIEAEELFLTIAKLKKAGKGVVLITHKLNEALAISDRISILSLGRKIAELNGDELRSMGKKGATEKILNIMFGDKPIPECSLVGKTISDQVVLQLEDVEVMNSRDVIGLKKVSFQIREGEIFGIAGVDGNGQKSLCESIAGQRRLVSGRIRFKGEDISRKSVSNRHEMGISYITDDRMNEGCVLDLSLSENAILRRYCQTPYSRFNVINNSVVDGYANGLISDFDVKATGPDVRAGTLSGGNIQKFILARGLSTKPGLIVCSKPTYGLDARTVSYIQELLLEESKQGTSVLLITSDMDELINCSDRIGVLFNGQIMGVLDKCDATPEKIGKLMLGIKE